MDKTQSTGTADKNAIGIDVAKETFVAAIKVGEHELCREFRNSRAGFESLQRWLPVELGTCRVCVEATGGYEVELAEDLYARGAEMSVVNPRRVKAYADSGMRRNKTDKVDASVLRLFCEKRGDELRRWEPTDAQTKEIRGLVTRLQQLERLKQTEQNRLQAPSVSDGVKASLNRQLALLRTEIATVEHELAELMEESESHRDSVELVKTIPGIGRKLSRILVALIGDISRFDTAAGLAAYVAVCPAQIRSGSSLNKTRLSNKGHTFVRSKLWLPAMTAKKCNPQCARLAERLAERGLSKKAVTGAVVHKLVRQVFGVLSTGNAYRPDMA